jgi:hypothetical protein
MSIELDIDSAGLEKAAADAETLAEKLNKSDQIFVDVFEDAAEAARGSVHKISGDLQRSIKVQGSARNIKIVAGVPYAASEFKRGGSHAVFVEDAIRMLDTGVKGMIADLLEGQY